MEMLQVFNLLLFIIPIVALFAVLRAVTRGRHIALDTLNNWNGSRIRNVKRQGRTILSANLQTEILKLLTELAALFVTIITLAIYIPLVLNLFPETEWIADAIFSAVLSQLVVLQTEVIAFIPKLIFLIAVIIIVRYFLKILHLIFNEVQAGFITLPRFQRDWAEPSYQLIRGLVLIITGLYIYSNIPGSQTLTVQGAVIVTSIFAGLGARDIISDIVSGVVLTYASTFKVGDRVQIGETKGIIHEKSLLNTRIRTGYYNRLISIPNSIVLHSEIINLSTLSNNYPAIRTNVTVGYEEPWRKVRNLLLAAAEDTGAVLSDPAPKVFLTKLDDYFVRYELRFRIEFTDNRIKRKRILAQLHQKIRDHFDAANVRLVTPLLLDRLGLDDAQDTFGASDEMVENFQEAQAPISSEPQNSNAQQTGRTTGKFIHQLIE